uniref:Uncharacterized protein n=1 Tax=Lepeophtheirus salmonis TaxID=72036 RepID=A0A0K2V4Z0_LEPSM
MRAVIHGSYIISQYTSIAFFVDNTTALYYFKTMGGTKNELL